MTKKYEPTDDEVRELKMLGWTCDNDGYWWPVENALGFGRTYKHDNMLPCSLWSLGAILIGSLIISGACAVCYYFLQYLR